MKTRNVFVIPVMAFLITGCAIQETYYAQQSAARERSVTSAVQQARTGITLVTDPNFFVNGRDCKNGPMYVEIEGENGRHRVPYGASQSCSGYATKSGGAVRPELLEGVSIEECRNFQQLGVVPPQCAKYGMPTQGGTR
jgi:hypothetical protein